MGRTPKKNRTQPTSFSLPAEWLEDRKADAAAMGYETFTSFLVAAVNDHVMKWKKRVKPGDTVETPTATSVPRKRSPVSPGEGEPGQRG